MHEILIEIHEVLSENDKRLFGMICLKSCL